MQVQRVFALDRMPVAGERIEQLLARGEVRIERILSASGPCDQAQDEWVLLLQGRAVLEVKGQRITLDAGDALFLPAHTPHSVLNTSAEPACIWLAVHIGNIGT